MKKRSKTAFSAPRALKGNSSDGCGSLVLREVLERKKESERKAFVFKSNSCPAAVAPKRRSGFSRDFQAGEAVRASMVPAFGEAVRAPTVPAFSSGSGVAAGENVGLYVVPDEAVSAPVVACVVGSANAFDVLEVPEVAASAGPANVSEDLETHVFDLGKHGAGAETAVPAHASAGESVGIIDSFHSAESSDVALTASGCVASVCARRSAAAVASLAPAARVSSPAVFAVGSHARFTPMHDARNSCSHTVVNSLGDQRSRKVRLSRTVGNRSVVQTVDMSPAPDAGTYRRSADEVHAQRQILWTRQAASSGGGPGPGPGTGPGGRCGLVGGSLDCAAAFRGIPCSLVMPPGRHQRAPQSLGWARVCGTEKSGVWVLKGDARTYNLPRNLDDVGIVWERRSGYETAWATPGHVCSCSYGYGHGPVLPQPNPSVFTEAVKLWSRVASLLTPWCAKGEVPTGVNLNRYAGDGSFIPWHCDNERLFGSPFEPKVIVSMSLGHSVLFKLRRRASEKTVTQIWLDHGDLLVMDGLTQDEFQHSTASELEGPRVNLTYRWISQHIRSCPLAGLICGALPSEAQDLAEPNSRRGGSRKSK